MYGRLSHTVPVSAVLALDHFTHLVLHHDRLPMLVSEASRTHKGAGLQSL